MLEVIDELGGWARSVYEWFIGSAAIGVMFPVLLTQKANNKLAEVTEGLAGKVLVAVIIQAITATTAVTVGSVITINVMDAKVQAAQLSLQRVEQELNEHRNGGHPWTIIERVNGVEHRLDRIEKRDDRRP